VESGNPRLGCGKEEIGQARIEASELARPRSTQIGRKVLLLKVRKKNYF